MSEQSTTTTRWRLPEPWRPSHPLFAFHEDSNANAVLITPSGEVFAVAEERISRSRFQAGFPARSLSWLEKTSGVSLADAPLLVFGNRTHFLPRILGAHFPTYEHDLFGFAHKLMLSFHHACFLSPAFAGLMALFNKTLLRLRYGKPVVLVDHHHAHAVSAFFTSGQKTACAVTADNFGDGYSAKVFDCDGSNIRFVRGVSALNSPGQFYGEIAQIAGIHPLLAGKLTGMAASGDPTEAMPAMRRIFDVTADQKGFTRTFGWRRRGNAALFCGLEQMDKPDLAAAAQQRFEEVLLAYVQKAVIETGRRNVVLAGGSFANVRLNQRILELPEVDSVWIHPAMTDQGIAMGAALTYLASQKTAESFRLENVLLGPEPTEGEIKAALEENGLPYTRPEHMAEEAARLLAKGKVIARFSGPLEYGPRALGNRSVLYQTTDTKIMDWLNRKLQRAPYMPFAPVTLFEYADKCYRDVERATEAARFMTISFQATDWMKQVSPGVVHLDGTVRPQILRADDNPDMHAILTAYHRLTGIPSLLNTSFNLHHEPIVNSAADACRSFLRSELDAIIAGPFLARRPG